jgi:hypothetical protein
MVYVSTPFQSRYLWSSYFDKILSNIFIYHIQDKMNPPSFTTGNALFPNQRNTNMFSRWDFVDNTLLNVQREEDHNYMLKVRMVNGAIARNDMEGAELLSKQANSGPPIELTMNAETFPSSPLFQGNVLKDIAKAQSEGITAIKSLPLQQQALQQELQQKLQFADTVKSMEEAVAKQDNVLEQFYGQKSPLISEETKAVRPKKEFTEIKTPQDDEQKLRDILENLTIEKLKNLAKKNLKHNVSARRKSQIINELITQKTPELKKVYKGAFTATKYGSGVKRDANILKTQLQLLEGEYRAGNNGVKSVLMLARKKARASGII